MELAESGLDGGVGDLRRLSRGFQREFHDLRRAPAFRACLESGSYVASQALAESLLAAGSLGVVYPSVRHRGGTCLACFRPPLVGHVRRGDTYRFTWTAGRVAVTRADGLLEE